MEIVIAPNGDAKCVYAEALPMSDLGKVKISRASHVEPNTVGQWMADLSPVGGPCLGPFKNRSNALAAETDWLKNNWLTESG
jgi:hypothetical protein